MRWETNVGNGVVGVEFDRKDIPMNKLGVAMLESRFRVFDVRTQHPTEGFASLTEKVRSMSNQNRASRRFRLSENGFLLSRFHIPFLAAPQAHKATVWMTKHLPQCRDIFLTAGGNGGVNLYKYHYPPARSVADEKGGPERGVIGSVELLNARVLSSQPFLGFDWSPDKEGLACAVSLDQTARVFIVTKLSKHF